MKITKYPQSCLLIETKDKKILVDPGDINYKKEYFDVWNTAETIFVTHKHSDHCYVDVLRKIDGKIYSSSEVKNTYPELPINIVKEGEIIDLGNGITVEVVHAEHGFVPPMKKGGKVVENIGFIIDDNDTRVYITSDTICFENNYQCDILCVPISDHGVVMGPFEAALVAKDTNAKLTIPIHADNPKFPVDMDYVKKTLDEYDIDYEILENEETIEIE